MFYGTSQYDPIHIIAQIASIQAIFYITLGALYWLLVGKLELCSKLRLTQTLTKHQARSTTQVRMSASSPYLTYSAARGLALGGWCFCQIWEQLL